MLVFRAGATIAARFIGMADRQGRAVYECYDPRGKHTAARRGKCLFAGFRRMYRGLGGAGRTSAWTATLGLADRFGLTVYDAAYLELARRRGVPLATVDEALRCAGRALGVPMLGRKT